MLQTDTLTLSLDEPAYMLQELNLPSPDSRGKRRMQLITVVRGDRAIETRRDLGEATTFKANQFNLVGGFTDRQGRIHIFHSVGEMLEMADELRTRDKLPDAISPPVKTAQEWLNDYHDEADRRRLVVAKRSIFGPHYRKMRY